MLNPEWISHGVYAVINWVHEQKGYSLNLEDFATVFKENAVRYPKEKHKYLFKLMKAYELAYETEDKALIIPHLLKKDRPGELPEFPVGESLMLRYTADQPLPPDTISRFIVRHNQEITKKGNDSIMWRSGVLLEDGKGSMALVRETDHRIISVFVKGKDKTAYLSKLRETLDEIFKSYESKMPELQYRVKRFGEIPDETEKKFPLWLPENLIATYAQENSPYLDPITREKIYFNITINEYNIEGSPRVL